MLELRRTFLCVGTSETEQAETPGQGRFPAVAERSSFSKKMGRKAPCKGGRRFISHFNGDLESKLMASQSLLCWDENAVWLDHAERTSGLQ